MARAHKKAGADGHTTINGKVVSDPRITRIAADVTADGAVAEAAGPPAAQPPPDPPAGSTARAVAVDANQGPAADPFADPRFDHLYSDTAYGIDPYAHDRNVDASGRAADQGERRTYVYDLHEIPLIEMGAAVEAPHDTADAAWARSIRRFARAVVWAVPGAAFSFALAGVWGWPTPHGGPTGQSGGTWLVVTVLGLVLGLLGMIALAALLVPTPGRRWALTALIMSLLGTVLLAPMLGVIGLARPSVTSVTREITAGTAATLEAGFFDGDVSRWLGVWGLILLALGWFALGCAVLASRMLNRADGWLMLLAVAVAIAAAYLSWQFLLVIAAMVLLASGLGLAWTASRLTPDGGPP